MPWVSAYIALQNMRNSMQSGPLPSWVLLLMLVDSFLVILVCIWALFVAFGKDKNAS